MCRFSFLQNAMTPVASHLSFWLIPAAIARQLLQDLINRLCDRYRTVSFVPHVTVFSGAHLFDPHPVGHSSALVLEQAIASLKPVHLSITGLEHSDLFAKTLFIQFQNTPTIQYLADTIKHHINPQADFYLNPHLSLLYHHLPASERHQLTEELAHLLRDDFPSGILLDELWAIAAPAHFTSQADVQSLKLQWKRQLGQPSPLPDAMEEGT